MAVHIDWNDVELDRLLNSVHGPVGQDLERRAILVENAQKKLLSLHGTGRIYTTLFFTRGHGPGRTVHAYGKRPAHQASAPGEPPATDTGRLRATVGHSVGYDERGLYANIGSGANPAIPGVAYAAYQEYGTDRIEPRPWMRPSLRAGEGDHHT